MVRFVSRAKRVLPGLCLVLGIVTQMVGAAGTTYYVSRPSNSPAGSDARSCGTAQNIATPLATLNTAVGCLTPGDTLLVRGGTYPESLLNTIPSGNSSNRVRIANYNGETVWMQPASGNWVVYFDGTTAYIDIDGININGAGIGDASVFFDDRTGGDVHHVRFQNLEVHHREGLARTNAAVVVSGHDNEMLNLRVHGTGGPYAFYLLGSSLLVDGCDVYETSLAGIQIYHNPAASGGGAPVGSTVRNTKIHNITTSGFFDKVDTRLWGIIVYGTAHQLYNNLIYSNSIPYQPNNAGIFVYYGINVKVWNNTVYGNNTEGITVNDGSTGTELRNNIAYANTGGSAYINAGTGTTQSNNMFAGVDPRFVDASAGNFQLQASSPARNAGTAVATVTTDFSGASRPKEGTYDIGAYEFSLSNPPPAAPTNFRVVPN